MPTDYHRKQTIAGGERFITPALKDYEEKVLGADEQILERELALFSALLRARSPPTAPRIQESARALATLDVLAALGEVGDAARLHQAADDRTTASSRSSTGGIRSSSAWSTEPFVPERSVAERHHAAARDPDRAEHGRQVDLPAAVGAASSLLAQAGSFVPARQARLPVVDRIFARVGASDNIARGYSTFMVEMRETARILHTATSRSLVVLDEIGRGTATFDGLSIAWAVAEYLVTNHARAAADAVRHALPRADRPRRRAARRRQRARRWCASGTTTSCSCARSSTGRSDRSYGIQVARLAGLPAEVVARAREILIGARAGRAGARRPPVAERVPPKAGEQLGLFAAPLAADDELTRRLAALDVDRTDPARRADGARRAAARGARRSG